MVPAEGSPGSDEDNDDGEALTRFERLALGVCRFVNEDPRAKAAQAVYHRQVGNRWVSACTKNLIHVDGLEKAQRLQTERGVLLAANHRSFFDQYVTMSLLFPNVSWAERVFFPVRSNFFYETWAGLAVNLVIGGLVMYPPIFRQPSRSELNKQTIEHVTELVAQKGVVVGMHPEGTRGKGPDPYQLLPAQPGVGQVIMKGRPAVLPVFIHGLSNDFVGQIAGNFRKGAKKGPPIVVVFGDPVDFGAMLEGKPRPAQYKRVADRVLDEVRKLGERERVIRAGLT